MLSTIIIKPTRLCNADCAYCSTPANAAGRMSLEQFEVIMQKVAPLLAPRPHLIWHGGEPMLMGPEFYRAAGEIVRRYAPEMAVGMQSNILLYASDRWKDVIANEFGGRISTSFDPDERNRTLKGSVDAYSARFVRKLDELCADGFRPGVIGTFDEAAIPFAGKLYDLCRDRKLLARFNYRYPAGRADGIGQAISPESYGAMLCDLFDRWLVDREMDRVTPLDQMIQRVFAMGEKQAQRCPWTSHCGGRFLGIEFDGATFHCPEFSDLRDPSMQMGNIFTDSLDQLFASPYSRIIRRRRVDLRDDCRESCPHFAECEGGCMRDAILYGKGIDEKTHYCASWKMVFTRIKAELANGGEARLREMAGLQ